MNIKLGIKKILDKTSFIYCVYNQKNKCGFIHLRRIENKKLEVSIIIDRKFRKRGVAFDALHQAINQKFLSGYKICASCKIDNYSSIRLFESLGFVFVKKINDFKFFEKVVN